MYTVSKGPSKIVAKSRRGISQNYEKFETIKESGKRNADLNSPEKNHIPRPVFQTVKKSAAHTKVVEEEVITPQHEEIINYINDSWNILMAQNPYDDGICLSNGNGLPNGKHADSNNNCVSLSSSMCSSASTSSCSSYESSTTSAQAQLATPPVYCVEPPSPVLSDFQPFDLESWWGRRLFNNITKSL